MILILGDELCESKRARLSQDTKQEFRKCYARIISWSETVLSRLEHNVTQSLPFQVHFTCGSAPSI